MRSLVLFSLILLIACNGERTEKKNNFSVVKSPLKLIIFNNGGKTKIGDTITIAASAETSDQFSEVNVEINDSMVHKQSSLPLKLDLSTKNFKLGQNSVRITASNSDKVESKSSSFVLLADRPPEFYDIKVIRNFPHDRKAYTQGLVYKNGILIEGTGQKGASELRTVDLESGAVTGSKKMEAIFFGEGVCVFEDKIFQLTWQSQTGMVYDSESLEEISRFYYTGEGWGLTTDGKVFYRSDGSHTIYVHETNNFSEIGRIQVYSDQGPLKWLNELEYIDGKIFANIWQKDQIAIIDPSSGRLEGLVNLNGLLPKKLRDQSTDVLNGIAYDAEGNRLFVTGKYWPKLYEIELLPQSKS